MTYLEMFILVLAIILFTTAAAVHHRSTLAATDALANATYRIQGTQLAQEMLDWIDAQLLRDKGTTFFTRITNSYNPGNPQSGWHMASNQFITRDLAHFGASYKIRTTAHRCDANGNVVGTATNYRRVDVEVWGPDGLRHPVLNSRVYTSWNL